MPSWSGRRRSGRISWTRCDRGAWVGEITPRVDPERLYSVASYRGRYRMISSDAIIDRVPILVLASSPS